MSLSAWLDKAILESATATPEDDFDDIGLMDHFDPNFGETTNEYFDDEVPFELQNPVSTRSAKKRHSPRQGRDELARRQTLRNNLGFDQNEDDALSDSYLNETQDIPYHEPEAMPQQVHEPIPQHQPQAMPQRVHEPIPQQAPEAMPPQQPDQSEAILAALSSLSNRLASMEKQDNSNDTTEAELEPDDSNNLKVLSAPFTPRDTDGGASKPKNKSKNEPQNISENEPESISENEPESNSVSEPESNSENEPENKPEIKSINEDAVGNALAPLSEKLDQLTATLQQVVSNSESSALKSHQDINTFIDAAHDDARADSLSVPLSKKSRENNQRWAPSEDKLLDNDQFSQLVDRLGQIDQFHSEMKLLSEKVGALHNREYPIDLAPLQAQISDMRDNLLQAHGRGSLDNLEARLEKLEHFLGPLSQRLGEVQQELAKGTPDGYHRLEQMILELSTHFEPVTERFQTIVNELDLGGKRSDENFHSINQKLDTGDQRFSDLEKQLGSLSSRLEQPMPPDPIFADKLDRKLGELQHSIHAADSRLEVLTSFEQSLNDLLKMMERSANLTSEVAEKVANKVIRDNNIEDEKREALRRLAFQDINKTLDQMRAEHQETSRQSKDQFTQLSTNISQVDNQISEARKAQGEWEALEKNKSTGNRDGAEEEEDTFRQQDVSPPRGVETAMPESQETQSARGQRVGVPHSKNNPEDKKSGLISRLMGSSKPGKAGKLDPRTVKEAKIKAEQASKRNRQGSAKRAPEVHPDMPPRVRKKSKKSSSLVKTLIYLGLFAAAGYFGWQYYLGNGVNIYGYQIIKPSSQQFSSVGSLPPSATAGAISSIATISGKLDAATNTNSAAVQAQEESQPEIINTSKTTQKTKPRTEVGVTGSLAAADTNTAQTSPASASTNIPLPVERRSPDGDAEAGSGLVTVAAGLPKVDSRILTNRLRRALANKEPNAYLEIGRRYSDGELLPEDPKSAEGWFGLAANRNLPVGFFELGRLQEKSARNEADFLNAFENYKKAASGGNVRAMHNLALGYAKGLSGKRDSTNAAKWFHEAAKFGIVDSQFNYAILVSRGLGTSKDPAEAYKWFALAEKAGDKEAGIRKANIQRNLPVEDRREADKAVGAWRPGNANIVNNEIIPPPGGWNDVEIGSQLSAASPQ